MRIIILYLVITVWCCSACNANKEPVKNPEYYNLSKPEKFAMPESLLEISGISFYNNNSDTVYAIQDEEGKLFRLGWGNSKQLHSKFARQGDYEDLTILNNQVIILKSNGTLYRFPVEDAKYIEIDDVEEIKNLLPEGEYESLYGDDATGNLILLCKNCPRDKDSDKVTGYILSTSPNFQLHENFEINTSSIKKYGGSIKRGFRPSAIAKNPFDKRWYILSSINHLLVIADSQWNIIDAYPLSGNIFNQPEGIAFDQDGNMYISNEGDEIANGNILKFKKLK